jgi:hypothetical protein
LLHHLIIESHRKISNIQDIQLVRTIFLKAWLPGWDIMSDSNSSIDSENMREKLQKNIHGRVQINVKPCSFLT